jgi:hypothetical protein
MDIIQMKVYYANKAPEYKERFELRDEDALWHPRKV